MPPPLPTAVIARPLWERLANETDPEWAAFQHYLRLGPERDVRLVMARHARAPDWADRNDWAFRAGAYDLAQIEDERALTVYGRAEDERKRHATLDRFRTAALAALTDYQDAVRDCLDDAAKRHAGVLKTLAPYVLGYEAVGAKDRATAKGVVPMRAVRMVDLSGIPDDLLDQLEKAKTAQESAEKD